MTNLFKLLPVLFVSLFILSSCNKDSDPSAADVQGKWFYTQIKIDINIDDEDPIKGTESGLRTENLYLDLDGSGNYKTNIDLFSTEDFEASSTIYGGKYTINNGKIVMKIYDEDLDEDVTLTYTTKISSGKLILSQSKSTLTEDLNFIGKLDPLFQDFVDDFISTINTYNVEYTLEK
ncbi:MAG: hypothetical protein ACRCVT_06730 [Leadbetterella sp.]